MLFWSGSGGILHDNNNKMTTLVCKTHANMQRNIVAACDSRLAQPADLLLIKQNAKLCPKSPGILSRCRIVVHHSPNGLVYHRTSTGTTLIFRCKASMVGIFGSFVWVCVCVDVGVNFVPIHGYIHIRKPCVCMNSSRRLGTLSLSSSPEHGSTFATE